MNAWRLALWAIPTSLSSIGLATLYSATRHAGTGLRASFESQKMYLLVAMALALVMCRLRGVFWHRLAPWAWLGSVGLLIWVLIDGAVINKTRSWLLLGGLSIQPAELLKITLVLALARLLQHGRRGHPLQELLLVAVLAATPLMLILQQPDLGGALALIPVVLALCHAGGYSLPRLGLLTALGSLGVLALVLAPVWGIDWLPLRGYQVSRLLRLLHQDGFNPLEFLGNLDLFWLATGGTLGILVVLWRDRSWSRSLWILLIFAHVVPLALWIQLDPDERIERAAHIFDPGGHVATLEEPQLLQAKAALGNGGRFGQGWLQGEQTQYQRLPYSYSDLIFASFAEEWGLLGAAGLLLLYLGFSVSCLRLAALCDNSFAALCLVGIGAMIASQVLIHVGYTTGLLPMTGITLPFLSAGGSSLMIAWLAVAIAHGCGVK